MEEAFQAAQDYIRQMGLPLEPKTKGVTSYQGHPLYKYMSIAAKYPKSHPQGEQKIYVKVRDGIPARSFDLTPQKKETRPKNKAYTHPDDTVYNSKTAKEAFNAAQKYITTSGLLLESKVDGSYTSYRGHTLYKGMRIFMMTKGTPYVMVELAGLPLRTFRLVPKKNAAAAQTELHRRRRRKMAVPMRSSVA